MCMNFSTRIKLPANYLLKFCSHCYFHKYLFVLGCKVFHTKISELAVILFNVLLGFHTLHAWYLDICHQVVEFLFLFAENIRSQVPTINTVPFIRGLKLVMLLL